jgi:hypothetical protein
MLESNATYQVRNLVQRPKGSGPIGHGKAGIIAGNEGTGNDQKKRYARSEDGKSVMRTVVRQGDSQSRLLADLRSAVVPIPSPVGKRPRDDRQDSGAAQQSAITV